MPLATTLRARAKTRDRFRKGLTETYQQHSGAHSHSARGIFDEQRVGEPLAFAVDAGTLLLQVISMFVDGSLPMLTLSGIIRF